MLLWPVARPLDAAQLEAPADRVPLTSKDDDAQEIWLESRRARLSRWLRRSFRNSLSSQLLRSDVDAARRRLSPCSGPAANQSFDPAPDAEDGSVAVTLLPCPLVDAEHARCSGYRGMRLSAELSKQCRPACKQPQFTGQPCACSATERERDPTQCFTGPETSSRIACHRSRQRFCKDVPRTSLVPTEELPCFKQDLHWESLPRQVCDGAGGTGYAPWWNGGCSLGIERKAGTHGVLSAPFPPSGEGR